jgi:hypothetical protein
LSLLHLPYDIFTALVPGARNVRVPARLVLLAAIFLAPVIAEGWQRIFNRGHVVGVVLLALVVAEGLPGLARYEPAALAEDDSLRVPHDARGLLFLPLGDPREEIRRMWLARRLGVPVVNGYSGHPSWLWEAIRHLQSGGMIDDARHALHSRLLAAGVDTIVSTGGITRIPPTPVPSAKALPLGRDVGLLVPELGWSYPERDSGDSWVWTLDRRAGLSVPMDGSGVRTIAFRVRALDNNERLELWWNGQMLGAQPIGTATKVITFELPDAATRAGWTSFEIVGPPPERPRGSDDPRRLSVCVYDIALR